MIIFFKFSVFPLAILLNCIVFVQMQYYFDLPQSEYSDYGCYEEYQPKFYGKRQTAGALGGTRSYSGEFKHMAAIGWERDNGQIYFLCGGSLISKRFVLTAAHCVYDEEPDVVRLGDTDLGSPHDDDFAQQIRIARTFVHPSYNGWSKRSDVALIELRCEARLTSAVCPACLWRDDVIPEDQMEAIGFGALYHLGPHSPTLQRVVVNHLDQSVCEQVFAQNNYRTVTRRLRENEFCTTGIGMDTCEGDSGGPVSVKRDLFGARIWFIVGVVSFGQPCSYSSIGVHSKVSEYVDWIEDTTGESMSYEACIDETHCPGRATNYESVWFPSSFGPYPTYF